MCQLKSDGNNGKYRIRDLRNAYLCKIKWNKTMTIQKILHQSLKEIFSDEIDEGFFLFVKRESNNMLIGSTSNVTESIRVNGKTDSLESFSSINPESIKGMAVISEHVTYWFDIVDNDHFEIRSGSNLLGRSTLTLLKMERTGVDNWIVEKCRPCAIIPENVIFKGDFEMAQGVFGFLADYGNPYKHDEDALCRSYHSYNILINVTDAVLYVNGNAWLYFPDF